MIFRLATQLAAGLLGPKDKTLLDTLRSYGAMLNVAQSFTKPQRTTWVQLTDGATITPDFNAGQDFYVTLGGNRTIANPSNLASAAGQGGMIKITQDGTGSRVPSWGSAWNFEGGVAPTLSTAAGAVDMLWYKVEEDGANITAGLSAQGRS